MSFDVSKYIPQRYPFEMIDKIVAVQPAKSAESIKNVSINEWFLQMVIN